MRHTFAHLLESWAIFLNRKYRESVDTLRANTLFVILTVIFGAWLAWDAAFIRLVTYAPSADYWEHAALFNEWLNNFSAPANPHVADPSLSPRYMPMYWALTWVGLIFGLDAIDLMSISAVFNYLLIVIGLYLFLKSYFRTAWAPTLGFIAIFLCWGVSWNWSNIYHIRSFFYVAGFPSSFVFGLSLISFYASLRVLRNEGAGVAFFAIGICLLSALMFISHPLTGVFGIAGCVLLALINRADSFGSRVVVLFAVGLGLLFAEQWPYFSPLKLALGLYGSGAEQWFSSGESMGFVERYRSGDWQHIFYSPRLVLIILGPALLGLPLCIWLLIRREYLFIVLGAACMAVPYFLHLFVEVPLAHRFLLFVATFFHFAIVWGGLQVINIWYSRPRPAYAGKLLLLMLSFIAVLFAVNIYLLYVEFSGRTLDPQKLELINKRDRLSGRQSVVEIYTQLTGPLEANAVVLATPLHGWPLPAIKAKVVSLYHENPMLLDQQERYVATLRFFEQELTAEQRAGVIARYGVTHVLVVGAPKTGQLGGWLSRHTILVAKVGEYRMYKLRDNLPMVRQPEVEVEVKEPVDLSVQPEVAILQQYPAITNEMLAPKVSAKPLVAVPAESVSQQTPTTQPAENPASVSASAAGNYGAPVAAPLISVPDGTPPERAVDTVVESPQPQIVEQVLPEEVAEQESAAGSYGVPIAGPVLDPQRHGGE
jgi:hypothetical protein